MAISCSPRPERSTTTDRLLTTSQDFFRDCYTSHELRVASRGKGRFGYTTGVFFYEQTGSSFFQAFHPFVEAIQRAQGRPPETWYISDETQAYRVKAKARFGEGHLNLDDTLRATLGARWTSETRDTRRRNIVLTDTVPFEQRPASTTRPGTAALRWTTPRGEPCWCTAQ